MLVSLHSAVAIHWSISVLTQDGIISRGIFTFTLADVAYELCLPTSQMNTSQTEFSRTI